MKVQLYKVLDVFGFRAAALPISTLDDWVDSRSDHKRAISDSWLVEQFRQPYLNEALFAASPSLAKRWSTAQSKIDVRDDADWIGTLAKYLSRACSRATPFGLFAGVSSGEIGDRTELVIHDSKQWLRRVRLDHAFLLDETRRILGTYRADPWMLYVVNSTLHRLDNYVRYFVSTGSGTNHSFRYSQTVVSEPLSLVLELCERAHSRQDLVNRLSSEYADADVSEVEAFLDNLVGCGILVSALSAPLTGSNALREFLDKVPHPNAPKTLERLANIVRLVDGSCLGDAAYSVEKMSAVVDDIVATDMSTPSFQIDSEVCARRLTLGDDDVAAVSGAVDVLSLFSHAEGTVDFTNGLVRTFSDRWGDSLVPLGLVADDDAGLSFSNTDSSTPDILRRLDLRGSGAAHHVTPLTPAERWLRRRAVLALKANESEIVFTPSDLKTLRSHSSLSPSMFPDSISVLLSVYESANRSAGRTLWIENVSNSATALLGRFCSVSRSIHDAVARIADEEQKRRSDVVLAEIVHLPRPKSGNVTSRPVLRAYEIPYAATSGAPEDRQLKLRDLFVGVDERRHFFLWSKRLQRKVLPVLASAHNFGLQNGLNVYRFLCSLAAQGKKQLKPLLTNLDDFPEVPRIRVGRCVLRAASWHLDQSEFDLWKEAFQTSAGIAASAADRGLPRLTSYGVGDQTLTLDLLNPILVRCFLTAKHRFPIILREASPAQLKSAAIDQDGHPYRHQIILPMLLNTDVSLLKSNVGRAMSTDDYRHAHLPGGKWLSLKIYAGVQTLERLLVECLPSVVSRHSDLFGRHPWFYVRYADPDPHLRIRFCGAPAELLSEILPAVHAVLMPLRSCGLVARMQTDTYVPEIGRYGGFDAMPFVEDIFRADSDMHLQAMSTTSWSESSARLAFGVRSVCAIVKDFGSSGEQARSLLARLAAGMVGEFGGSSKLKKQIGDQYRNCRQMIGSWVADENALIAERSVRQQAAIGGLRKLDLKRELQTDLVSIVSSVVHMSLNRLFVSHARQQEMLVYEFARRYIAAQIAQLNFPA